MRKRFPNGIWLLLASYLFFLASHFILLAEPSSRNWLQSKLVKLSEEQDIVFRSLLGRNYFIVPDGMYYTKPPYYYTHLDAIYYWWRASHSLHFRTCSGKSHLCSPGVSYFHEPRSDEYFRYLYQIIFEYPASRHKLRCGNGIIAIIDNDISNNEDKNMSFSTINGFYIVTGVHEESINLWLDECEHDLSGFLSAST